MTEQTTAVDFVSFQVRDVGASARFYEDLVGLRRVATPNPDAAVFAGAGTTFAVRAPLPGTDLDAIGHPGAGVGVWFGHQDAAGLHERLAGADVPIVQEPFAGPFGVQFAFRDPDGYVVTVHTRS